MTHDASRQLDRRLAACDPVPPAVLQADRIEDALDAIGTAVTNRPRPETRSRRPTWVKRPRRAAVIALAITAIGGGVATGALFGAHTGQYAKGWQVQAGGPGEYLRMAAPDFCRVALQLLQYPVSARIRGVAPVGTHRRGGRDTREPRRLMRQQHPGRPRGSVDRSIARLLCDEWVLRMGP